MSIDIPEHAWIAVKKLSELESNAKPLLYTKIATLIAKLIDNGFLTGEVWHLCRVAIDTDTDTFIYEDRDTLSANTSYKVLWSIPFYDKMVNRMVRELKPIWYSYIQSRVSFPIDWGNVEDENQNRLIRSVQELPEFQKLLKRTQDEYFLKLEPAHT